MQLVILSDVSREGSSDFYKKGFPNGEAFFASPEVSGRFLGLLELRDEFPGGWCCPYLAVFAGIV